MSHKHHSHGGADRLAHLREQEAEKKNRSTVKPEAKAEEKQKSAKKKKAEEATETAE